MSKELKYRMWFYMPNTKTGKLVRCSAWMPKCFTVPGVCKDGFWMSEDGELNPVVSKSTVYVPGHQIICVVCVSREEDHND